jgi:phage shock protein PspC (stress-responsive transcriptional regulator)
MTEQSTAGPKTGMDKFFAALRGLGVRRRTDDKWIGGVCSGLADRLGVDPVIVRAALVLLSVAWGIGITVYLVAWSLLPNDRNEIAAERALRDGDAGSIVLVVITAVSLFGGGWWGHGSAGGFGSSLVVTALVIWWLVKRSRNNPDADHRVSSGQPGSQYSGPSPSPYSAGPSPTPYSAGQSPTPYSAYSATPPPAAAPVQGPRRRQRRRSGGSLMALLAIGIALVSYGSAMWLADTFTWPGSHAAIALAGSLAAIGLLLLGIGAAGWRAGFVGFLAVVLALAALSSSAVPAGIHVNARVGDESWAPTPTTLDANYHLGVGDGVLDLRELPNQGLSGGKIPASVGIGDLKVLVPEGLKVTVVGHVGLGEIVGPGDARNSDQGGGADQNRSIVVGGPGPTEVEVDAGVGLGQLTVVKE